MSRRYPSGRSRDWAHASRKSDTLRAGRRGIVDLDLVIDFGVGNVDTARRPCIDEREASSGKVVPAAPDDVLQRLQGVLVGIGGDCQLGSASAGSRSGWEVADQDVSTRCPCQLVQKVSSRPGPVDRLSDRCCKGAKAVR